jgi:hypothetical protein
MGSQIRATLDGLRRRLKDTSERLIAANLPDRYYARYKESLIAELEELSIPGREAPLDLGRIYCPRRLRRYSVQAVEATGEEQPKSSAERSSWEDAPMEVTKALLQSSRLVILGGPGSGKTTLLRHLALTFARDAMPQEYVHRLMFTHQDERMDYLVPILVCLPEFARSGQDLLSYLVNLFAEHGFPYAEDFLQAKLGEGRCLLLFDRLDAVADREERERIIRQIREVAGDRNQILFTSRPAGYDSELEGVLQIGFAGSRLASYRHEEAFLHLELVPFGDEDIERFTANWFAKGSAEPDSLLAMLERCARMRSMAANPLLLSVLAVACDRRKPPQ